MTNFIQNLFTQAKRNLKTIILVESEDPRIIEAASIITKKKIANIILIGNESKIKIKNVQVINPLTYPNLKLLSQKLFELRKDKGLTQEAADELIKSPYYFGTMLVKEGLADGMVAGACCPTADVLRPALQIIKTSPGQKIVSTFIIIDIKNKVLFFADCGLNINPNKEELANIAIQTADSFKYLTSQDPKIAMLSFSTNGSGYGETVDKVKKATLIAQKNRPDLLIEGEIQADTALIPQISQQKYPKNKINGEANILIFPDLNSGNISYKLVQRLANAKAFGPITQGLNKPINDLSRSCNVKDIIVSAAITAIQASTPRSI